MQRLIYTGTNYDEVKRLCGDKVLAPYFCMGFSMLSVDTGEGFVSVNEGDTIVREDNGTLRIEKQGIVHYFVEQGEGFPLILLHGNGEDGSYFEHQMAPFARHFRVIAPDTRGHGRTPRGEAPFTIRQFAEDLLAFMDRLGIAKAHLLGFSDGGNIAMVFALAHPERVEKLILDGANLDASGVKRKIQIPIEIGYRVAKLFAGKRPEAKKKAELLGLMVNDPDVKPEELARIPCPTLVVAGDRDMIKDSHTRLIAKSIPGAQLAILPGDHFVANKNPDAFNDAVLRFLL